MAKEKYVFNETTLQYERDTVSIKNRILKVSGFLTLVAICSVGLYMAAYTIIPTPKAVSYTHLTLPTTPYV